MTTDDWEQGKKEVKNILIERAKLRGMIPYSELVSQITSVQLEAHDPRLINPKVNLRLCRRTPRI